MVNSPHPHLSYLAPQVTTARLENARLSSSLSSALAFRASLLPDEGHSPAGPESGAHIQQLGEEWENNGGGNLGTIVGMEVDFSVHPFIWMDVLFF